MGQMTLKRFALPGQATKSGVTCAGIRDHVVQSVELKFNCFFLMPVVDTFPTRLREDIEVRLCCKYEKREKTPHSAALFCLSNSNVFCMDL